MKSSLRLRLNTGTEPEIEKNLTEARELIRKSLVIVAQYAYDMETNTDDAMDDGELYGNLLMASRLIADELPKKKAL